MIDAYVQSCLGCQAATLVFNYEPLKPTRIPERPWEYLAIDLNGPVASQHYFLVAIDEYSRYPEVEVVESTSAEVVLPKLDRVLSTRGIPLEIKSDNGSPFKSIAMKTYAKKRGFFHRRIEPEQPSSNGLAENFMKRILKVSHTATVARKDPREEAYKFLLAYRATPHSTMGVSRAELLFNRKINTTIPTFQKPPTTNVHKVARSNDNDAKTKMKEYHDTHRHAKASEIGLGDTVLVKQRKSTTKPFYNPTPLIVSAKKGSMITATNKKFTITRDAAKF